MELRTARPAGRTPFMLRASVSAPCHPESCLGTTGTRTTGAHTTGTHTTGAHTTGTHTMGTRTVGTHTVLPQAPSAPRGCPGRTFTCNI